MVVCWCAVGSLVVCAAQRANALFEVMDFAAPIGAYRSGCRGIGKLPSMPEIVGKATDCALGQWVFPTEPLQLARHPSPASTSLRWEGGGAVCDSLAVFGKTPADHGGQCDFLGVC